MGARDLPAVPQARRKRIGPCSGIPSRIRVEDPALVDGGRFLGVVREPEATGSDPRFVQEAVGAVVAVHGVPVDRVVRQGPRFAVLAVRDAKVEDADDALSGRSMVLQGSYVEGE